MRFPRFPFSSKPDEPSLPDFDRVPEGFVRIYSMKGKGILVGILPIDDPSVGLMQESGNFIVWN